MGILVKLFATRERSDYGEMDLDRLAKELHGDADPKQDRDDDDPFAEGNYIPRA